MITAYAVIGEMKRMSEQEEIKTEKIETVNVTLTVPLPVAFHKMLKGLSEIVGLPIETILTDDLYSVFGNYFDGDFFNGWIQWFAEQKGVGHADKERLEKEVEATRATLF
jgi:hypothetical protein